MADQPNRIPQYQHLYEALRQDIIRGVFKAGDLLPSESVLQQQYRLTQPTIRQALSLLVQEGYIKKHQGKGSIVQSIPIGLGVMSLKTHTVQADDKSAAPDDLPADLITTTILAKPTLCPFPDDMLFFPAGEQPDTTYYCLERLRSVDGTPVFSEKLILPNRYVPNLARQRMENRSFFDLLRTKYGLVVTGGEQKIQALPASLAIAERLQVAPGSPVLRLEKRVDTNKSDFSFFSLLFARTDQFLLQGRF
ncbi:putative HTH-type transcriptional regulator ymfC [Fibrella aestuarina BUZ 2]|uniref:Putative HTH-type transcriptional regulator ymfC n=1 Tax=Fibrella aestuarina BUZ 2 TaxID=1166018 RepID=I0K8C7_9BACT|nr:GntR family transcriptional regulator [Fibrella aestuarina]CCH00380.1 putative HTH-type transcriptional regulator ymfC [Fibrella aestuarina BUZ 2]